MAMIESTQIKKFSAGLSLRLRIVDAISRSPLSFAKIYEARGSVCIVNSVCKKHSLQKKAGNQTNKAGVKSVWVTKLFPLILLLS